MIYGTDSEHTLEDALDNLELPDELTKEERVALFDGTRKSGWSCTWSADGMSVACGPRHPRAPREMSWDEVMAERQSLAGQEDQSEPEWDDAI